MEMDEAGLTCLFCGELFTEKQDLFDHSGREHIHRSLKR